MTAPRFALIGAAGFVAPRHLEAIKHVGGRLVAALDPHDAVGILDRYDRDTEFFTEPERFERHLEMLKRDGDPIDWLVICSPNYLHDAHIRMGLRAGAKVICEKPLVLDPKNLDALADVESGYAATGERRVFTVLQLRHMPAIVSLYNGYRMADHRPKVVLRYTTPRGRWYYRSWKSDDEKSGGIITNIGIHMLDALQWIWGPPPDARGCWLSMGSQSSSYARGGLSLARADATFELSIDGNKPERTLIVDDYPIDFTTGFEGLHNRVYEETLAGRGHGIEDARPAIEMAYRLRRA